MAGNNRSWTDWVGKRGLHCSRNPSAYVTNGIIDSTVRSMNYLIQKPGDLGLQTYSLDGLRVAVASGELQCRHGLTASAGDTYLSGGLGLILLIVLLVILLR